MTSQEFVSQLKKDIQAFPKIRIKHPFLKAVCAGIATMDQIRAWAIQDYQFRAAVPRIVLLRYLACTDPEIARNDLVTFGSIEYRSLYQGITLRFTAENRRLKSEYVVEAGHNPGSIRLRYPDADRVATLADDARSGRHE